MQGASTHSSVREIGFEMDVHMSAAELNLFKSFLACSRRYMEFGTGGSTCLAAAMGKETIISIDSSDEWLAKVHAECSLMPNLPPPRLINVDIGPTGEWGVPIDPSTRERWPSYYQAVWTAEPESAECDLFLIDGRFRVACFMSVVLRCGPTAIILIHDFFSRPHYHVVKEVCGEIARAEELSAFQVPANIDKERARTILDAHAYDPG
jgi:hypothetical protein